MLSSPLGNTVALADCGTLGIPPHFLKPTQAKGHVQSDQEVLEETWICSQFSGPSQKDQLLGIRQQCLEVGLQSLDRLGSSCPFSVISLTERSEVGGGGVVAE